MAACPKCYALLPERATLCQVCGTPVAPAIAPSPPVAPGRASRAHEGATVPTDSHGVTAAVPELPRIPLHPGERVVGRFSSSVELQARVARGNALPLLVMVGAISLPFLVLILATDPYPRNLVGLVMLLPIVMIGGLFLSVGRSGSGERPTTAYVTDRRIIVDRGGKEPASAVMGLDSLGDVVIRKTGRAATRAGVAWVYLLPEGTITPFVGRGRYQVAAPGVIWLPAVPYDVADTLRATALSASAAIRTPRAPGSPS